VGSNPTPSAPRLSLRAIGLICYNRFSGSVPRCRNAFSRQHLNLSGKLQPRKVRRNPLTMLPLRVNGAAHAPLLMPGRDGNWEPVKGKRHRNDKAAFEELWKAVEALPKKRWTRLKREFDRVQSISNARIRNTDAEQAEQLEKAEREAWNQFGELCQRYGIPLEPRLLVILNRLH